MIVTYIEKGIPFDFKRRDTIRKLYLVRTWKVNGLLYGYKDTFNVVAIPLEDIISIEE